MSNYFQIWLFQVTTYEDISSIETTRKFWITRTDPSSELTLAHVLSWIDKSILWLSNDGVQFLLALILLSYLTYFLIVTLINTQKSNGQPIKTTQLLPMTYAYKNTLNCLGNHLTCDVIHDTSFIGFIHLLVFTYTYI